MKVEQTGIWAQSYRHQPVFCRLEWSHMQKKHSEVPLYCRFDSCNSFSLCTTTTSRTFILKKKIPSGCKMNQPYTGHSAVFYKSRCSTIHVSCLFHTNTWQACVLIARLKESSAAAAACWPFQNLSVLYALMGLHMENKTLLTLEMFTARMKL